jgi:phosphohistidine phosphatase
MPDKPKSAKVLWLLRHAKTVPDPPPGGDDFDRVLAPRGRRDATALGRLYAAGSDGLGPDLKRVPRPTVALVSPAARTTATAELVLDGVTEPPEQLLVDDLYGADPNDVLDLLRTLSDDLTSVMVVGHNPTAQWLSQGLIGARDKAGRSLAAQLSFPTCALGVYRLNLDRWADVEGGSAKLLALLVPPFE